MGTGHLMRCLALAQAWRDTGGKAVFVTACNNDNLLQRLRQDGFDVRLLPEANFNSIEDWQKTSEVMAGYNNEWVLLDGYHFSQDYQQQIKDAGYKLLVIDDMAQLEKYHADIILNQNLHAGQLHYNCQPYTKLLLGSEYVLLRREFLACENCKHEIAETAKKILITMGGSDPNNITLNVIQSLEKTAISGVEATIVTGAANPNIKMLEAAVENSRLSWQIIHNADSMPGLMAETDIAVSAAGSTVWELAFMGVPSIITAATPLEQTAAALMKKHLPFTTISGLGRGFEVQLINALNRLTADREMRYNMSALGQSLVDGQGCERVIKEITK